MTTLTFSEGRRRSHTAILVSGALVIGLALTWGAMAQGQNGPAAVFAKYEQAVNSGDVQALADLIDESVERSDYPRCKPEATNKECLVAYVSETIIHRKGKLKTLGVETKGDTAYARLQFSSDGTRAAGVERAQGVDVVKVANGRIVAFHFKPDVNDPQTTTYFDAIRRRAARPAPAA